MYRGLFSLITYSIIGGYIALTVCCIIKKMWLSKSLEFNFLWLILYNDFLTALSVYVLWTPSSDHVTGTTMGYLPGEFIILTTVPLLLMGFIMKSIFLSGKEEERVHPTKFEGKSSGGLFWYIFISWFPAWFTFCMAGRHLMKLPMWFPFYFVGAILLPVVLPLLPRLYQCFKRGLLR